MSASLEISYDGAVARITLNRPDVRNAFNDEVIAELTAAFQEMAARAEVRAVVLAGHRPGLLRRRRPELDAPHGRLHPRREPA